MAAASAPRQGPLRPYGVGLAEFLVALLIFSTAIAGVMSAQLAGKRAIAESHQRAVATALATDLIERLQGNPSRAHDYETAILGDRLHPVPEPPVDCAVANCAPGQLAAHDLRRWEQLLLGAAERSGGRFAAGLPAARACVRVSGAAVRVVLSWRGLVPTSSPSAPICPGEPPGLYDARGEAPGNDRLRRLVVLPSYLAAAP